MGSTASTLSLVLLTALGSTRPATRPIRDVDIRAEWLRMADGVRLSATCFLPREKNHGERFPVLLELLPYRKDDSFYLRDYPLHTFLARRGFASVKVDVRGTGSSEGRVPDREYSAEEIDDAVEVIAQLSRMPWSNGRVGMWGISWSGFNAIETAMRRPPALKAILAAHSSDQLYRDSIDYIDGAFHVDPYHLQIHHENGLPRSPDYPLDEAYFRDRFDVQPWFFDYLRHPSDGAFWRRHARDLDEAGLEVPAYLIGALLDGYRDAVLRILENARAPVRAEIGPWNHAWPHDGEPGPNYEWGETAVRWFERWLNPGQDASGRGVDTSGKRLLVFVRDGHPPDAQLAQTPGHWREEEWPIRRTRWSQLYPGGGGRLLDAPRAEGVAELRYVPSFGAAAGLWWGEPTGDMRPDDAGSLVFDSPPLDQVVEIVGFPRVRLRVSADAPLAHWVARLEDVLPDGRVALVTGALMNGAQRGSATAPEPLIPGQEVDLAFDLHFTTWTFRSGHRIRLAVTNAQFPMIWPTPHPMTTRLVMGESTVLALPVIPHEARPTPDLLPPEAREARPDAHYLDCPSERDRRQDFSRDLLRGTASYETRTDCAWEIGSRRFRSTEHYLYTTSDPRPSESSFLGEESHRIELGPRTLELHTRLEVRSDVKDFHVAFVRRLIENGAPVRERTWRETIPREFQ